MDVAIAEAHVALDEFRFNDAAQTLYHFVWGELCDWYIELAKLALQGDDARGARAAQATLVTCCAARSTALHPIMPFVTDEIAASLPGARRALPDGEALPGARPRRSTPSRHARWRRWWTS